MPAGLRPADSLNQLRVPLGIPDDSIRSESALVLAGVTSSQVSFTRSGQDVTLVIAPSAAGRTDGGSVNLLNLDPLDDRGVETIVLDDVTASVDQLRALIIERAATAGNDSIVGFSGDDSIVGGAGNDTLSGGGGVDTYTWRRGDGNDVIDEGRFGGSGDRLLLNGVTSSQVSFTRSGQDVTLVIAPSAPGRTDGGSVRLLSLDPLDNSGVETIVLSDATWTQNDVRTRVLAAANNKGVITRGFSGADTYTWNRGDGAYIIEEGRFGGSGDRLVLTGVTSSQVSFTRSGQDVTLVIAPSAVGRTDGGNVKLLSLDPLDNSGVETIVLSDATWSQNDVRARMLAAQATAGNDSIVGFSGSDSITGGAGNDTLSGGGGADTYTWRRGDGNDVIDEGRFGGSGDRLVLTGVTSSQVSFTRSGQDVTLVIAPSAVGRTDGGSVKLLSLDPLDNSGVETIVLSDATWSQNDVRARMLAAQATAGNDSIVGFSGSDSITGGAGNDTLSGGAGNDTFRFQPGFGRDVVLDFDQAGDDQLLFSTGVFANWAAVWAATRQVGSDLVITKSANETVTLKNVALSSFAADDVRFVT